MAIELSTFADLGYRRLGPSTVLPKDRTDMVKSVMEQIGWYEFMPDGDVVWFRDRARKKGQCPEPVLRKVATISKHTYERETEYDFVNEYLSSPYPEYRRKHRNFTWDSLKKLAANVSTEKDHYRGVYDFATAITLCDPDLLGGFLRKEAFPSFFKAFPGAVVQIYMANMNYEKRYGMLRGGYALQQYPLDEINVRETGFATLRSWHSFDTTSQPKTLLKLLAYAFYPRVYFFPTGPLGLHMAFIFGSREEYVPPVFPSSWLEPARSQWDFAAEQYDDFDLFGDAEERPQIREIHGQIVQDTDFSADHIATLIEWFVMRYNELCFHISDPAEFVDNKYVDFVSAFEHALMVDRILRRGLACITAGQRLTRKQSVMEMADIFETQRTFWLGRPAGQDYYKHLFHPEKGFAIVSECLAGVPSPFNEYFIRTARNVYSELESTVRDSVWVKSKIIADGVMVKDSRLNAEVKELWPDFTASVVRALRNTHHGYLTDADPSNRPSRYLALINGNLPDSLTYLGLCWTLCMLARPDLLPGWKPLEVGKYA